MFSFSKAERLCSKKLIGKLFAEGQSINAAPIKAIYLSVDAAEGLKFHQILVTVSRRNVRSAVLRNAIKRRIREAYRLNKHLLGAQDTPHTKTLIIAFVYTGKQLLDFAAIQSKIILILQRLSKAYVSEP